MMASHKPSLAVLIGTGPSHGDMHPEPDGDENMHDGEDKEYADAGEEIMHAMKQGDAKGLADAVCALMDLHMASKEEEEPETDEGATENGKDKY